MQSWNSSAPTQTNSKKELKTILGHYNKSRLGFFLKLGQSSTPPPLCVWTPHVIVAYFCTASFCIFPSNFPYFVGANGCDTLSQGGGMQEQIWGGGEQLHTCQHTTWGSGGLFKLMFEMRSLWPVNLFWSFGIRVWLQRWLGSTVYSIQYSTHTEMVEMNSFKRL